ncbi:triose-phosphate isomerase [Limosilactobacillus ingluviei]|uniref:Triosephosphate isomerase n=1 Tax=Limosilactobacillus ingluviei TaxID=148604 RepID=A0A0R2GW26_9LACO|nr:triose-phosphate isomerase [Limosilactobacillus ingluviei]KRN45097.1 triosephosphate isomerase [Limosilactobacillus ingluviei]
MRKPLIVGNWKMYKTITEAVAYVDRIKAQLPPADQVEVELAVPTLFLQSLVERTRGTNLKIAAENCFYQDEGAFTGETSPVALRELGIKHVILGHSERRRLFYESDAVVNQKVHAALQAGICPLLCVDETMKRQVQGDRVQWVVSQVLTGLAGVTAAQLPRVTLAYEPSWAIGAGKAAATPSEANEGCYLIRQTLARLYGESAAARVRILYGGSVNQTNLPALLAQSDIDGVLIGRASLDPAVFLQMVAVAQQIMNGNDEGSSK